MYEHDKERFSDYRLHCSALTCGEKVSMDVSHQLDQVCLAKLIGDESPALMTSGGIYMALCKFFV
jgi:hypothetical protein